MPGETLAELIRATGEKEFLFGDDLCSYLDGLYSRCVTAYTLHLQLEGLAVGEVRNRRTAWSSWASGAPNSAMIPSPITWLTVPS